MCDRYRASCSEEETGARRHSAKVDGRTAGGLVSFEPRDDARKLLDVAMTLLS